MPPVAFKQRDYVGAFCEAEDARVFRVAAELDGRSVSSALRVAMRRFSEQVAATRNDDTSAFKGAEARLIPTTQESERAPV